MDHGPWMGRQEALLLVQFERERQAAEARQARFVRGEPAHSSRRRLAPLGRLLVRLGRALEEREGARLGTERA